MELKYYFPTPIWSDLLDFDTEKVASRCLRLREEGYPDRKFSNRGGWQSKDVNLDEFEEFHIIRQIIDQKIDEVSKSISDSFTCKLGNIWVNINDRDCENSKHVHPCSTLSGTIYIQTDANSGRIVFLNEETPMKHYTFKLPGKPGEKSDMFYENVSYQPKNGMIIIFPSWVSHYVEKSNSDIPRISISFNTSQVYDDL